MAQLHHVPVEVEGMSGQSDEKLGLILTLERVTCHRSGWEATFLCHGERITTAFDPKHLPSLEVGKDYLFGLLTEVSS